MEPQFHPCRRAGSRLYPTSLDPGQLIMRLGSGHGCWWSGLRGFPYSEGVSASQRADSSSNPSSVTANSSTGTGVSRRLPNTHLKNSSQPCPGRWGGLALVNLLSSAPENLLQARYIWKQSLQGHWDLRIAMPFYLFCCIFFLEK